MTFKQSAMIVQYYRILFVVFITSAKLGMIVARSSTITVNSVSASQYKGSAFVTPCTPPSSCYGITSVQKCQQCSIPLTLSSSTTRLSMSSPPPSRQSYSSSGGGGGSGKRTTQQTRNRGANAANRNQRGYAFRFDNKDGAQRVRKKSNTKRPPRWEREGDKLYAEVTKQLDALDAAGGENDENDVSKHLLALAKQRINSAQDVCEMLEPWTVTDEQLLQDLARKEKKSSAAAAVAISDESEEETATTTPENKQPDKKTPPFLWGNLPVGPVLATRLRASQRSSPTSVQRGAFPILTAGLSKGNKGSKNKNNNNIPTKRTNAIIASPTGTGKTLAYLLPLLCTSPGGQSGEGAGGVLIVTPTIELACQIQRELDVLWPPPVLENEGGLGRSSLFVVGADDSNEQLENEEKSMEFITPGRITLRSIQHAPLIAGTPKMLRMLYKEAGRVVNEFRLDTTISKQELTTSRALLSNLRAVVLDEADRLLRTEAVARETAERKQRKIAQRKIAEAESEALDNYTPLPPKLKKKRLVIARQTQTELLLRDLPIPSLDDVQIICASATIGRTMRRQLMQILDAPSADAAATLVTGDEDERVKSKDAERRKSVLLPGKLQHAYRVVDEDEGSVETEATADMSRAEMNEEKRVKNTISTLWDNMMSMEEAKPIIIFPGRVGVERVQKELIARGLDDVRTLRNLDGTSPETDIEIDVAVAEELSQKMPIDKDHEWKSIPVYIIGERFARGLDIPEVEYVFILSPPSSAAGYAHMAGRTGRVGRTGTAVTLVRPKNNEVQRLAAIAEALGLKFAASKSGVAGGKIGHSTTVQDGEGENSSSYEENSNEIVQELVEVESTSYPWKLLSESALKQKKNAELLEYLVSFGETINKRSKKAELVSAIQMLHSKS